MKVFNWLQDTQAKQYANNLGLGYIWSGCDRVTGNQVYLVSENKPIDTSFRYVAYNKVWA